METNLAFDETEVELKQCPRCELWLPLSEFGICRARKDGLNLYCKKDIRLTIAAGRLRLREYKQSRARLGLSAVSTVQPQPLISARRIARMMRRLSPADRVKEAIKRGAETQTDIARVTKLPKDEVGEAIAMMLLYEFTIRTEVVDHVRRYFTNESGQPHIQHKPAMPHEPRSYGVSTIYDLGDPDIGMGMSTLLRKKAG